MKIYSPIDVVSWERCLLSTIACSGDNLFKIFWSKDFVTSEGEVRRCDCKKAATVSLASSVMLGKWVTDIIVTLLCLIVVLHTVSDLNLTTKNWVGMVCFWQHLSFQKFRVPKSYSQKKKKDPNSFCDFVLNPRNYEDKTSSIIRG